MTLASFRRHRFPAGVIRHAFWLYFRFSLSFRDVEEQLAQRGIEVGDETILCWTIKSGLLIARQLKKRRGAPSPRGRLEGIVCRGSARPAGTAPASSTGSPAGQQSGGELASADSTTRATAAAVQIAGLCPENPHHPRGDLKHLQHPAAFDQQTHPLSLPRRGCFRLGGCGCVIAGRVGSWEPSEVALQHLPAPF